MDNLVPIGRFSKICRLSISALRYYDEQGLLRPAVVDPDTSYRYYRLSQVRVAETIRLLRALEMPLEDVHRYLREQDQDAIKQLLNRHQRRLEERLEEDQRILSYLRRLQGDEYLASSAVRARTLDPLRIVCIRVCVPEQEVSGTWRSLATEIRGVLSRYDREPAGPIGAIFPDPVHRDDAVNMTVFAPIVGEISLQGRMHEERIAGGLAATILHLGPYTLLHRSYEQLVGWMQHHGHEMAGPPREIFRIGPIEVDDPNGYETEVVWPVH